MMNLADELTAISNESLRKQAESIAEKERIQMEKDEAEAKAAKQQAEVYLIALPAKLRQEAQKGRKSYKMHRLTHLEFDYPTKQDKLEFRNIKALWVVYLFEMLKEQGLNPKFEYRHNGDGMDSWYELWISWK